MKYSLLDLNDNSIFGTDYTESMLQYLILDKNMDEKRFIPILDHNIYNYACKADAVNYCNDYSIKYSSIMQVNDNFYLIK